VHDPGYNLMVRSTGRLGRLHCTGQRCCTVI
jgi:hypothetical protein